MAGLTEMRRGWTLLHENDCYLCEPFWGMHVAMADAEVGQLETGLEILSELIAWTGQSGQHWLDAELHRVHGELLLRHSDRSSAENALKRALEIARHQRTKTFELRSAVGLARLLKTNGRAGALPELLAPVLAEFEAERHLSEVVEAKELLKREH
ncbi:putative ATPase [Bradyrhizobium sp. GM24.11]